MSKMVVRIFDERELTDEAIKRKSRKENVRV